jgi:hypothetical protein
MEFGDLTGLMAQQSPNLTVAAKLGRAFKSKDGTRYGEPEVWVKRVEGDTRNKVALWQFMRGDCGGCGDHFR